MIKTSTVADSIKLSLVRSLFNEAKKYDDVIDFLINNNAALGREFSKSGSKFDSKSEFYDAYISGDYKNILKGKK